MLLNDDVIIKVTNRAKATVGYTIPDMGNFHRNYQAGETKSVQMKELRGLAWTPGGQYLLTHCFVLNNQDAIKELVGKVEPEYHYTAEEVKKLLLSGTLDQLKDCLDFAPDGVKEMVKDYAVKLEINDLAKREAIKQKLKFDVTAAIRINHEAAEPDTEAATEQKTRRAAPITQQASSGRRGAPITTSQIKIPNNAIISVSHQTL